MQELLNWRNSTGKKSIDIIINTIENVIRKDDINVCFAVEHNGISLGESPPITIKATCEEESSVTKINFAFHVPVIAEDKKNLDSVVSTPVLSKHFSKIFIKALYNSDNGQEDHSTVSQVESRKRSIYSAKSDSLPWNVTMEVLGICNLDLMPIVLGEQRFIEKLILETPKFSFDGSLIPWKNLPRLVVTVSRDRTLHFQTDEVVNFLYATVESIYNLPDSFTENLEYKSGTIVYTDSEVPENLIFENGTWTKHRDVERTKRWNTLHNLENRARLSKYKLDCDFMGVKNEFKKIDLAKKVCEDAPRIEWNSIRRCLLQKSGIEAMRNHLTRYKYWPFQFVMKEKDAPAKSKSGSPKTQLYQCYVDLSELLFPGRRSCRVVAQLFTYNPSDITEKVGLDKNIFVSEAQVKEPRERDKKHKTSKHTQLVQSEAEEMLSISLLSEDQEPTIVVIEVELHEPLVACTILQDFTSLIADMIPSTGKKQRYVYSGDLAEEQYENCIQKLAEVITECYRDFHDEIKKNSDHPDTVENSNDDRKRHEKYCYDPELDEITSFTQYLYKTGVYLSLRSTLRTKVTMLLDQKFKMPPNLVDSGETQNFIASVYTYLVEQMHLAVNKVVEGRYAKDLSHIVNSESLYFYAEEAYELGDLDVARRYYTTVIASHKNEPEPWTTYAIFLKRIGDLERAKECCLEAITLDRQYLIALLVYAAILFENRKYKEAEIFLRAITDFYPRFSEGWITLHLFYIRTEYYPGVDLTLRIAEKCMKDKNRNIVRDQEPLAWSTIHCPRNSMYMMTAVFLLKLHLCEFAEIALAQEMSSSNRSTHFLYYMAVEHYLTDRFEDALSHLEEARCNYGMDFSISSLMGHCHFKLGDTRRAIECHEFAHMLFDRPNDLHLVEVRLGYHYYDTGEYERAKRIFLSACKSSPSSQTWLGAGISCYELNEYQEAEIALSEANRIDNYNPNTWGYLSLLNMALNRYDEFSQCYMETMKNNLKNRKLWLRITNLMEALDYTPPNIVTEIDDLIEDHSKEAFEEQFENGNGT